MPLCTSAAIVLYYDITGDTADHDHWHTHEHAHERLSIPGFARESRWVSDTAASPRYLVLYEIDGVEVGTSPAYLDRLDHPTAWTSATMARFRGMVRGFASVVASAGFGLGRAAVSIRFQPPPGGEEALVAALDGGRFAEFAAQRGIVAGHLLRPALPPPMTQEQALRGADKPLDWVLLTTGHDAALLRQATHDAYGPAAFAQQGVSSVQVAQYTLDYVATAQEVGRSAPYHVAVGDR